jgi:hypothetical protein
VIEDRLGSIASHPLALVLPPTASPQINITGVGAASVLATLGELGRTGEFPGPRIAVGGFATAIILSLVAEVWPAGASGIALLMFTTAAFVYGQDAWKALGKIVSK